MTPEEKKARRRELEADPFRRSLMRKTQYAWRKKHKDEINARRRAKYAANKERERARQKAWRDANPDKRAASWKKWSSKPENRARLRARDRERYADPEYRKRKREYRREHLKDPKVLNHVRWLRRFFYHKHKHDAIGLRWKYKFQWLPHWKKVAAGGPDRVARYFARCAAETRSYFIRWYRSEFGIQLDPMRA